MKKKVKVGASGHKIIDLMVCISIFWLLGMQPAVAQMNLNFNQEETNELKYRRNFAEGLRHRILGEMDQAAQCFQTCIELKPESGQSFYELATISMFGKDYVSAEGYARNAWKRDQKNEWYGRILLDAMRMSGKAEACVPVYEELQKAYPHNMEYVVGEIQVLEELGKFKEALKVVRKLKSVESMARWAVIREKEIYNGLKEWEKGAEVMEKWLGDHQDDFEIRGILAETYSENGDREKARNQYLILKQKNPENPAVHFSYGQFLFHEGKKEEALVEFVKGFRSPDVNPMIKIEIVKEFIGDQKEKDKLEPEVVSLIETLYESDKGDPGVDALYANYLYAESKVAEAEPIYNRVVKSDPDNFIAWQNLLFINNERNDFERMWELSDSALLYFPGQAILYLFKGIAAIGKKDYTEALNALKKGLTIPGQNPEVTKQFYITIAEAWYKTGEKEEAFKSFEQLLVLDPENAIVLNNYAYYLSLEDRELDKALAMIEKCIGVEKENPTYLDTYAWVLFKRKDYKKALDAIEKVMKLEQDHSGEVIEHFGDILYMNGRTEEAKNAWLEAEKKEGSSAAIAEKIRKGLK